MEPKEMRGRPSAMLETIASRGSTFLPPSPWSGYSYHAASNALANGATGSSLLYMISTVSFSHPGFQFSNPATIVTPM
jgi:hypothetical protein